MASYKTPGVYVEEIPKLPQSVADVPTAIPGFIGYTEFSSSNSLSQIYSTSQRRSDLYSSLSAFSVKLLN